MKSIKQTLKRISCWCFLICLSLGTSSQLLAEAPLSCDGRITCFRLNKQDGSALISLQNGMSFCESDFSRDIRIRTCQTGEHESLRFTITGPSGTWTNTENHVSYDSKQFWPTPGTYTIKAELYERANLGGSRCDSETIRITVTDCSAPTVDCPNLNANIGDSCNDGNPNTTNDRVQNNCTCSGTPVTTPTNCSARVTKSGRTITVSNLTGAIKSVKFLDEHWRTISECNEWGNNRCGNTERYTVPSCGTYYVQIQTYADWSTPVCNLLETVNINSDCGGGTPTVDCPGLNANIGDACNDGNPNTNNDRVQNNCTCAGTPVTPSVDCPNLNANIGDACNDGNPNTSNDRVQNNCTCAGTPSGNNSCDASIRVNGNEFIVSGLNNAVEQVQILDANWATIASCASWEGSSCGSTFRRTVPNGTYNVLVKTYTSSWANICNLFETVTVGSGTPTVDCPGLNANIGDACNDGNPNTTNDRVQNNCTCAGTPVAPTTCNPEVVATWTLDECLSDNSIANGSPNDFSEFRPITYNRGFSSVNGTILRHDDNLHSCTQGRFGLAACSGIRDNCTYSASSNDAFRFSVTLTAPNGQTGCLTQLRFWERAPERYSHISGNTGDNDPPSRYGIRVLKNGREVYRNINNNTTSDWSLEVYDLDNDPDFDFTGTATFEFELLGYCRQGSNGLAVWDLDNIHVLGYTKGSTPAPTVDCPNLNANIGDSCNDGNPNTTNDRVQNNCTCAGTPSGGGSNCNLNITAGGDYIQITGIAGAYPSVGISDDFGNTIYQCHTWNGGCPSTVRVDGLAPGVYWVNAKVIDTDWVTVLCEAFEDPVVGGRARMGNGDTKAEVAKQSIEVESTNPDFKVYPNPASEAVNVSLEGYIGKDVTIQMIDYTGRPLKSIDIDNVENTSYTIPISRMSNGIYTVRILSQGIKPIGKKMIVNKQF